MIHSHTHTKHITFWFTVKELIFKISRTSPGPAGRSTIIRHLPHLHRLHIPKNRLHWLRSSSPRHHRLRHRHSNRRQRSSRTLRSRIRKKELLYKDFHLNYHLRNILLHQKHHKLSLHYLKMILHYLHLIDNMFRPPYQD